MKKERNLKGKSLLMIFDRHANLKYKYGSRYFWCRGYYVDTVGRNKKVIAEYIRNQIEEDNASDQISIKEYIGKTMCNLGTAESNLRRFFITIGFLSQQSSEKYFNNRRKSIELFIILVYNMSNTNQKRCFE